jgi:hypothetical protein
MDVRRAIELQDPSFGAETIAEEGRHTAFFMALMIPYGVLGRIRELKWDFQAGVLGGESMLEEKLAEIWQ